MTTRNEPRSTNTLKQSLVNGVAFQAVWMACVAGGAAGYWWAGPVALLGFAAWHFSRCEHPRAELALAAAAGLIGFAIDTAYVRLGLLMYPGHGSAAGVAPVWIVALWAGFALTLNHSLAWLHGRPLVAAVLGGISGPFSYWVGAKAWAAVDFVAPSIVVLAVLAAVWALAVPALLWLARHYQSVNAFALPSAEVTKLAAVTLVASATDNQQETWRRG